ncbi:hypothetical protein BDV93DRAFT_525483 [Ceratobasidium sp. AG-I]|nr:hypothetical protein BDV93DRAFT_525483 [Ceratobasidium sp. AG-I]
MDSPLTTAEFSRLRKSIQQRDRLLSQGVSTSAVDLNISRALSNLKMYLPRSQSQLGVVLADWDGADQTKKTQVVEWIISNILKEQIHGQSTTTTTTFAPPPPPPSLPQRANTIASHPQLASSPSTYESSYISERLSPSPWANPTPPFRPHHTPTNSFVRNQTVPTPTPPRELYTQAASKPPTPPPKDRVYSRTPSTLYGNAPNRFSPEPALDTQNLNRRNSRENSSTLFMSSIPQLHSPQPSVHTPVDPTRQLGPTYNISPITSESTRDGIYQQQSPQHAQFQSPSPHTPHASTPPNTSSAYNSPLPPLPPQQPQGQANTTQILAQLMNAHQQQTQNILAQMSQPTPSTSPSSAQANPMKILFEAMKKYQAQQSQQPSDPTQYQSTTPSASGTDPTQIFAAIQQQQQQQTNQILAVAQQQQQATFDSTQYLAQFQQQQAQNQNFAEMLAQMQANSAPGAGFDWSSLASGSGVDMNSILSGMSSGGTGVDWGSVAASMAGGMDPTTMALQGAGLF